MMLVISAIGGTVTDELQKYVALWTLPKRLSTNMSQLAESFSKTRWASSKKATYFKATASDGLSLYPIIACFIQAVYVRAGVAIQECACYLRLADLLDLITSIPHGVVTPDMIRTASNSFLSSLVAAGWRDFAHPKFHWIVHLARELHRWGMLLSCFVHERKHRMIKRYANQIFNSTGFDQSVLAEVRNQIP